MCLIGSVLGGGQKSAKIGPEMGMKIGGDAVKSGKNTCLFVIMRVRISLSLS